jgi:hypothetical protein
MDAVHEGDKMFRENDFEAAYEAAQAFAAEYKKEILVPLGPDFYGESGRDYQADYICPFIHS